MLAMFFASTYPEQTSALILVDACARTLRDVDYPWGLPPDRVPQIIELIEKRWGTGASLEVLAPSVARDERFRRWYARYERLAMGPGGMRAMLTSEVQRDLRSVLSAIRVPTLVVHRAGDRLHPGRPRPLSRGTAFIISSSTGSRIFRASSGSRSASSSIEPLRSANRTVTCLRSPSRAALDVRIFSARCFGV
jgi:pimeloyl-ACP methyl ester carboxylesterase